MHRYLKKQEFYWFPIIYKSKGLEEDIQPQNIGKLRIMIMKKKEDRPYACDPECTMWKQCHVVSKPFKLKAFLKSVYI